jgi:hypothetical protein
MAPSLAPRWLISNGEGTAEIARRRQQLRAGRRLCLETPQRQMVDLGDIEHAAVVHQRLARQFVSAAERRLAAVREVFLEQRTVALGQLAAGPVRRGQPARGRSPRKERDAHGRFHFVTVIVVPQPGSEEMSNSSMRCLTPGNPRPRPPAAGYPPVPRGWHR